MMVGDRIRPILRAGNVAAAPSSPAHAALLMKKNPRRFPAGGFD